ncbi:oxidoreductase [Kaistia sp. 32K]|uniref:ferredoxin reductase n=1 Tax=Kaistia sp. 32K TaxID=2795690 RepID=UPI001915A5EF|nr:ferredoxin reductase [Kaistia sp. 32K]BCP55931.1 oxidoreductase [Kaistia sp. 32K]
MSTLPDIAPQPERLVWQEATVVAITASTPRVKVFRLKPADWHGFTAGQHVDIRLTAPDGYQAERSYSIGSAPDGSGTIELAIDLIDDGEVSPFFHEVVEVGDTIEMRGPIGGHFIWRAEEGGPLLLIAGGSGLVPLMSILRYRALAAPEIPTALICSFRHHADWIWRDELLRRAAEEPHFSLFATLSREPAPVEGARRGRIDGALLDAALASLPAPPKTTFICGANPFVAAASTFALDAGIPFASIKAERYGG